MIMEEGSVQCLEMLVETQIVDLTPVFDSVGLK